MDIDSLIQQIDAERKRRPAEPTIDSLLQEIDTLQGRKAGGEVLHTTKSGGRVTRDQSGNLSYADGAYATSDPQQIDRILQGDTAGEVSISSFDQQTIGQAPFAARAQEFVRGTPFVGSYTDEAADVLGGKGDTARALTGAMQRERPGETMALNLGGAALGAVPAIAAAGPTVTANAAGTVGGRALQAGALGALAGGIEGGIYGAGEGGPGSRLSSATSGAVFGAGAGGALGFAAPYAAEGIKAGIQKFRGSDVKTIRKALGVSPEAARVIKNALDVGDVDGAIAAMGRAGDDAMLADAGQPARELLDAAANSGGRAGTIAREAVDSRVASASRQMQEALDTHLGKPVGREGAKASVRTSTAGARGTAYDAAYSKPIDYASNRGQGILKTLRRVPQSAINRANDLMRIEGVESAQIMASIADDGSITYSRLPDVRQIDYITRALDDVASEADGKGKLGGTTQIGRGYENLKRTLRTMVSREVPEYRRALDTASDAIGRVKAIDFGADLLRPGTTPETVAQFMRGKTKPEREAIKIGIRQQIDDALANVARTATDPNTDAREGLKLLRDMSSRSARKKLHMVLGSGPAKSLIDEMDRAATAFELRAAIAANSKTAIRQSIQGTVNEMAAPGMIETLASGEPVNATKRFVQIFTGNSDEAQALRRMGIYEEIAQVLTERRGKDAKAALAVVQKAIKGQPVSEAQAAIVGRTLAAGGALTAGPEASRQIAR